MNYLTQGCTTIVTGNCGSGPVDTGTYYNKIERFGVGPNVAHLLPQGSLRKSVMGTEQRAATQDELRRMVQLTAKAMDDGACGMTSGLIYVPSSYRGHGTSSWHSRQSLVSGAASTSATFATRTSSFFQPLKKRWR